MSRRRRAIVRAARGCRSRHSVTPFTERAAVVKYRNHHTLFIVRSFPAAARRG
jgi:hypothetical protein